MLGPVLAGDRAVWVEMASQTAPVEVHAESPSGVDKTIFTIPSRNDGGWELPLDLAASAGHVALSVQTVAPDSAVTVYSGTPDGGFSVLERAPINNRPPDAPCPVNGVALQGSLLAETRPYCAPSVTLRDLDSGSSAQGLPWDGDPYSSDDGLPGTIRIAGRYAAWWESGTPYTRESPPVTDSVVVWDLVAGREAYTVDLAPYAPSPRWRSSTWTLNLDVQDDGTVLIEIPAMYNPGGVKDLLTASVADPTPKVVNVPTASGSLALAGNLAVLPNVVDYDWAVVDLSGAVHDVFHYAPPGRFIYAPQRTSADFDGSRIVWSQAEVLEGGGDRHYSVHNEAYPFTGVATLASPAVRLRAGVAEVRIACQRGRERCDGNVRLDHGRKTLGRHRFSVPRAQTQSVRVKLSPRAVRILRRRAHGRAEAVVVSVNRHRIANERSGSVSVRR